MPNGESRNWIRFLITLESFHFLYGNWPSTINLHPFFIAELEEKLPKEDFEKLRDKIVLKPEEENPFMASGEGSNTFDYAREGIPEGMKFQNRALAWLNIEAPDYED